ncbi:unnamed protein product [Haemonchus placei]|uniref:TRAF-type domain-containing protein n=1 Tax=Haemonchus placei TaxID=6290 RepID=A0A0N4WY26_HAEPC|nr:unnamed protein product [Haemonchus placei]
MHKLERECQVRMHQIVEGMEAKQRAFTRQFHELKEMLQEAKSVFNRKGSKRKHDVEEELLEKRRICEQKLRRSEKELKDLDRFLSNNIVRERHSGDRILKNSEATLPSIFCRAIGRHYSDACPAVRTVDERLRSIKSTDRCLICIEIHPERPCVKKISCFYCNQLRPHEKTDHHASICRRPEEFVEAQRKRWETMAEVDKYRRMLDDCDADIRAARQMAYRKQSEECGTSRMSKTQKPIE